MKDIFVVVPAIDSTMAKDVALWILVVGFLVMMAIEFIKPTVRSRFHKSFFDHWLKGVNSEGAESYRKAFVTLRNLLSTKRNRDNDQSAQELISIMAPFQGSEVFSLPIEQLCAQINSGTQSLIEFPKNNVKLLSLVAHLSEQHFDLAILKGEVSRESESSISVEFQKSIKRAKGSTQILSDARSRISYRIQQSIDSFQISTSRNWRTILRLVSVLLSLLITVSILLVIDARTDIFRLSWFVIVVALGGGYFASVWRDAVAVIQRARRV